MKTALSVSLAVCVASSLIAGEPSVQLAKKECTVEVSIDGEEFAVFNFSDELPKPFFAPVRGPGGTIVTRPIIKPGENAKGGERAGLGHVHHKGIWLAVDKVNGVDFWAEKGQIANASVDLIEPSGNPARFRVVNRWLDDNGGLVVTETTVISIFANRLFAYDITFAAGDSPVTFGDTKEGLFGFRMVTSMREQDGGQVVNADGLKGTGECWGKTADWVDYYGEVEGKTFGVTLFDHPLNFRSSRYHVRNYGLFSMSPFGERAYTKGARPADPLILPAGGKTRLRYGLYIHAGDTRSADVAGTYRGYLKAGS